MKKYRKLTPAQWLDELVSKESIAKKAEYFLATGIGFGNLFLGVTLLFILASTLFVNYCWRAPVVFYSNDAIVWQQKVMISTGFVVFAFLMSFVGYGCIDLYQSGTRWRFMAYLLGVALLAIWFYLMIFYVIPQTGLVEKLDYSGIGVQ